MQWSILDPGLVALLGNATNTADTVGPPRTGNLHHTKDGLNSINFGVREIYITELGIRAAVRGDAGHCRKQN